MLPTTAPEQKRKASPRLSGDRPAWERAWLLVCEWAALAWVARAVVREAIAMPHRIAAPFQFDYEEGNILNALARITHGLSPYPDPHAFPNVLNPYGPVAYHLLAVPVKLFGLSFGHARVVIVAAVAATCVLLALTAVKLGRSRVAAAAFALIYPTLIVVRKWTWLLRVDFLALAFSLAGLYVFCRGLTKEDGGARGSIGNRQSAIGNSSLCSRSTVADSRLLLAAVLMVAALFIKYTFLAAPAACVLYLVMQRRWREAARLTAIGVALSVAALALTAALTRGTIFTHLFLTHPDPFYWRAYLRGMWGLLVTNRPLVALAGVLVVSDLWRRRISVATLWLALATVSAVTYGKIGSNSNHFLEWSAALCLCAGLGFSLLTQLKPRAMALAAAAAAVVWTGTFMLPRPPLDAFAEVEGCPQAYAFVRQQAGDILAENVGAIVLAGKTVWVSNPFVLAELVTQSGWSDKPLESMVQQRRFAAILLDSYPSSADALEQGIDRFSPQVVRAIDRNYRLSTTFECVDATFVYIPVN